MHEQLTRRQDDEGAVVVLFAIILGTGLIFILLALVVDLGRAQVARGEAQNVADTVALSLAYNCVTRPDLCTSQLTATTYAEQLASQYAGTKTLFGSITNVCGSLTGACPAQNASRFSCRPASAPRYVRVSARGSSTSSSGTVPFFFSRLFNASPSVVVSGCSQASWGQVSTAPVRVPIVMSICDFYRYLPQPIKEWKNEIAACTSGIDYDGVVHSGNFRGFFPVKRPTGSTLSWFDGSCSAPIAIKAGDVFIKEASDVCKINAGATSGIVSVLNSMLNVPTLLPVTKAYLNNSVVVDSFAQFTLLGYTIAGDQFGATNLPWTQDCLDKIGNATSGNKCIFGTFTSVVIPYQKIDYSIPNLGVNTLMPLP